MGKEKRKKKGGKKSSEGLTVIGIPVNTIMHLVQAHRNNYQSFIFEVRTNVTLKKKNEEQVKTEPLPNKLWGKENKWRHTKRLLVCSRIVLKCYHDEQGTFAEIQVIYLDFDGKYTFKHRNQSEIWAHKSENKTIIVQEVR